MQNNAELVETNAPEIYCDGIDHVELTESGNAKFVLYTVRETNGRTERREAVTIILPASAMPGGLASIRARYGQAVRESGRAKLMC